MVSSHIHLGTLMKIVCRLQVFVTRILNVIATTCCAVLVIGIM